MFLLGFISKRVINYTSKYNDDDEGYDDIIYYWIYIHTYSICIYMIHQKLYSLRHCRITRTSPLPFRLKINNKVRSITIIFIREYVHYTQPTQFIASNFAAIKPNAKLSYFFLISPVHPVFLYLPFSSSFNINYRALHVNRNHFNQI